MVFRQLNEQVQKGVDEVNKLAVETGQSDFRIMSGKIAERLHFYCECSDVNCSERVVMSYDEYKKLHRRRDRFIVVPGHEIPEVEKIVKTGPSYLLVEKYALPPTKVKSHEPEDLDVM